MLLVTSPVTHTGTMARESESNISTKLSIKDQLLAWTWLVENSPWIMYHSSGPDNGTTPSFSVESTTVGMIFILQEVSKIWNLSLIILISVMTRLLALLPWIKWIKFKSSMKPWKTVSCQKPALSNLLISKLMSFLMISKIRTQNVLDVDFEKIDFVEFYNKIFFISILSNFFNFWLYILIEDLQ